MNKKNFLKKQWEEIVQDYETQKLLENGYIRKQITAKDIL
jgi:hypothetical protein